MPSGQGQRNQPSPSPKKPYKYSKAQSSQPGTVVQVRRARPRALDHINPLWKGVLFTFNFIFWLFGTSVACLGLWILVEKDKNVRDILDIVFDPAILMCIAGVIICSLGFFGCLGALRENICLLKTFHILLTILLFLELAFLVLVFVFYWVPDARKQAGFLYPEETLKQAIVRYRDDDDLRDLIDIMQREFYCCGFSNDDNGYQDWQRNVYFNCSDQNPSIERCGVPHSCCIVDPGEMINVMCGFDTTNKLADQVDDKIYIRGCLKGFGEWLKRNVIIIGVSCLCIFIPQIFGIFLARNLIKQIRMQIAQWTL